VSTKKAQANALAAQLNALSVRASQADEAYDEAELHLQDVTNQLASAKARLGQTSSQLTNAQGRVKQMAILSYMQGGAASRLSLLIPESVDQFVLRGTYVSAATGSASDAIDALRSARTALNQEQSSLSGAQAQAQAAVAAARNAKKAAAAADAQVSAAYARVKTELGQALFAQALQAQAAAERARVAAALRTTAAAARSLGALPSTSRSGSRGISRVITTVRPPPPASPAASSAIAFAEAELGKPYMYGGAGGADFDCSGLTAWAWGHAGHPLPHSSSAQYYDTTHVSVADLQPGDLVFFGMPPHHVGIYVGGGEMINALHSGTNVEYDSIYVEGDLIGGGRVN
jgi:cell wall-associated NlpC family hydrolase